MAAALQLARRGLGRVAPNPAVGCVLAQGDRVLARGWTQPGGRPHAETEALARAGASARGATCYVTLEPCAHHGATPPCAQSLVSADIARCVVAVEDPDPRVSGKGLKILQDAGIEVAAGLCREQAEWLNSGYFRHRSTGRPTVSLKLATSLDGRIASRSGESRWITGPAAREYTHVLRARHDALLVGSGTAVADNPRLDVRLAGLADRNPLRVVLDGRLRLPLTHDLVAGARVRPTLLVTRHDADKRRLEAYESAGVEIHYAETEEGYLSINAVLAELGRRGITRLLVEGGGAVAAALLSAGLVDRLIWFHAPKVIGNDGVAGVAGFGLERLAAAPQFERLGVRRLGTDLVETYRRRA
jgi:diaminohydroxyphosphoribosylaminopyrimidine deaminase/5-amino-6-(5-phosphoribosylamino)uracil reductase